MERRAVIKIQLLVVEENEMERRSSSVEIILGVRRSIFIPLCLRVPSRQGIVPRPIIILSCIDVLSCFIAYTHLYRNIPPHRSVLPFIL